MKASNAGSHILTLRSVMSTNTYPHKTINGVKKPIHRHIMEDHLGRLLRENEHVYHINGDPKDNSLENLIVIVKNIRRKKE